MSKTIFNPSKIDFTKQPMFFGDDQKYKGLIPTSILYLTN